MSHNIIEDLNWRYAAKEFDTTKKISDEDFDTIMESLRLSPSSFGLQPWKFVVVKNEEKRKLLTGASWGQKQVEEASHLIVLCSPLEFGKDEVVSYVNHMAEVRGVEASTLDGFRDMMVGFLEKKDDKQRRSWMRDQVYIALGNLLTTCAVMRVDSCPMEGFLPSKYTEILGLKERGLRPVLVCPVGYRSSDDKYSDAAKVRYGRDELVEVID